MIKNITKKFKKKVYHLLTSGNADIAFYTEAYVTSNKEWVMKKPITFAMNLIKINLNCLILHQNYSIKELVPGRKCIARIHRRPKVYQFIVDILRYPYIITDVFNSLFELTQDIDSIYQKIEENYNLPGFYKLRKKKTSNYKSIINIYEEISNELSVKISKDIEISMLKEHLVLNPYMKRVLEIAAYNNANIIGILETCYSREDIEDILSEFSIKLSDIYVSSEKKLPFHKMRNEFIKNTQKINDKTDEKFIIISANYNKAFKYSRRYHFNKKYYRSSKEIMSIIPIPDMTKEFKEVYQTITGIELFGGQYNHKNIYEITYLYLAPAVYALLEQTYQKAVSSGARVLALCDPDCIFAILYAKYFGKLDTCIWSGFASSIPATKEDLNNLIEDCYFIESYPADRIAYSLGFSFQKQLLINCKEEFIEEALNKSRHKDKEVIISYLKDHLRYDKKFIVVDPMPGLSSLDNFSKYVREINPQIEIEQLSMSRFLNKDAMELHILHRILQMDTPYIIGIYGNQTDDINDGITQLKEITFAQPNFIDETKKRIINQALDDYCNAFKSYQSKNKYLRMYPTDINAILNHSKEGLVLLEEVLGGYIE